MNTAATIVGIVARSRLEARQDIYPQRESIGARPASDRHLRNTDDVTDTILDPRVATALAQHGIVHEVLACDPDYADTAAFCQQYGYQPDQAANAILVASKKVEPAVYAICVVLATTRLDVNHKVRELLGVRRLSFADADTTRELTGMMIGGVTPFGVGALPVYIDAAVMAQEQVVMGGGNRSSKVLLAPVELTKLPGVAVIEGLALPR